MTAITTVHVIGMEETAAVQMLKLLFAPSAFAWTALLSPVTTVWTRFLDLAGNLPGVVTVSVTTTTTMPDATGMVAIVAKLTPATRFARTACVSIAPVTLLARLKALFQEATIVWSHSTSGLRARKPLGRPT